MDRVDDCARLRQTHSVADAVTTTDPTGVDQPDLSLELLALFGKHLCVDVWVEGKESLAIASREGHLRLSDTDLSSSDLGGVSTDKVVHGLLWVELGDGGQHTEGIASEENDVLGMATDGWKLHVADVLKRVAHTSVGRQADVVIVDFALVALLVVVDGVLYDGAELDSIIDIGLLGTGETIGLGVAATLDVKDVVVSPNVLVITDEQALGVG